MNTSNISEVGYDWAKTVDDTPIYIDNAESGRKGYYCIDCGIEMIARKGQHRANHFSHDPKDIAKKGQCTFSNETYRHKIAKDILQRLKAIKVPVLYKYPPFGDYGSPNKIRNSQIITCLRVEVELSFYENANGEIKWGKDINFDNESSKYLLIRPDIAFFDINNKPILLIELWATNKIDESKLVKINSLGIDTIEVKIPRGNSQDIEAVFTRTSNTQWIYNNEQENTIYVPNTNGNSETIPPIDEFQRRLLTARESVSCRISQINNTIRAITKCYESEQYQDSVKELRAEIRRVEENTERNKLELQRIRDDIRKRLEDSIKSEQDEIANAEANIKSEFSPEEAILDTNRTRIEQKRSNLEGRYRLKGEELRDIQDQYRPECQDEIDGIESKIEGFAESGREFIRVFEEIRSRENKIREDFKRRESEISLNYRKTAEAIESIERRRATLSDEYTRKGERLRREFNLETLTMERELQGYRARVNKTIQERNLRAIPGIEQELKSLFNSRELFGNIESETHHLQRLRAAKEIFDQRTFKDWK